MARQQMTDGRELDAMYMHRCIQLAHRGRQHTAPNPMVGVVIVCDGRIIGEGWHRRCGKAHAEVNAVASVSDRTMLGRATIYVTLEPCSHYGKTPPCAKMLVEQRLRRVVVGCIDPFAKVHGRGIAMLREAGITVDVGVCEDECKALISHFATAQTGRPYVTLKWAQSADGLIDSRRYPDTAGRAAAISGRMTQMLVHKLRSECGAVMVGTHTALMDDPSLTVRHWTGDNPVRVVIDRYGTLPRSLHLFDGTARTIVYTTDCHASYPGDTEVVVLPLPDDGNPAPILADLASRQIQTLLVEGGAATLRSFIDSGLWDEARIETNLGLRLCHGTPAPCLIPGKAQLTGSQHIGTSRIDTYQSIG